MRARLGLHRFNEEDHMQIAMSRLVKFASPSALFLASSGAMAAVPPTDPPVTYAGPVTFASTIGTNVRFISGVATITSGAALDGYFWGTGDSTTQWSGGTVASYLQPTDPPQSQ